MMFEQVRRAAVEAAKRGGGIDLAVPGCIRLGPPQVLRCGQPGAQFVPRQRTKSGRRGAGVDRARIGESHIHAPLIAQRG